MSELFKSVGYVLDENSVNPREIFARNLQKYMDERKMNQQELAAIIGVSAPTVNEWLKAKNHPRNDKIEILANYFGILKSDLIEDKSSEEEKLAIPKEDAELREIMQIFTSLNSENRAKLLELSHLYLDAQSKK